MTRPKNYTFFSTPTVFYTSHHYYFFNISLSEPNLRKRLSTDRCMPLPWTPHQGPDKSWANNNLWVKALKRSNAAGCSSDVLQCAHNQYFFLNADFKVSVCLMKTFLWSVLEQNLKKNNGKELGKLWLIVCSPNLGLGN